MMKRIIPASLFILLFLPALGQRDISDTLSVYFSEIKGAATNYRDLWGKNLYGPMLLVNPRTRRVFANEPDRAVTLEKKGNIFAGSLPESVSIANTALDWHEKYWAMIMIPLPEDKQARINLLAHELFHRSQPALGFVPRHSANNHLDKKEGRIYLRLELQALKEAIHATAESEIRQCLTHAFVFRKYRHQLYPGSDTTENLLELNEGLAEFTGAIVSGRDPRGYEQHFKESIQGFVKNPTFVRSFAYETIPVYGYLLYKREKDWPRDISQDTNLTRYFMDAFAIDLPADLEKFTKTIMDRYNGQVIIAEETARAERMKKLIAEYRKKFIESPHFDIHIKELKGVSFDPRTLVPIGEKGTVYPMIRVVDNWGILTVEDGALITPPWKKITLTLPTTIEDNIISGERWVLKLAEGYTLTEDKESGNYTLTKQ